MAETLQAEGKTAEALLQMQHYAEAMELTVTSDTRADLLEIEKRYDCSALERQNDAFRNRWALTVLLTVAVLSSLALLVFLGWSFFRKQRMELLKRSRHEVACLQQQIDSLQEQIDDNQGEARTFQEKLMALEAEKKVKRYASVSWKRLSVQNIFRSPWKQLKRLRFICRLCPERHRHIILLRTVRLWSTG